jgi:DNA polymerase III subunit chi
MSCVDFYILDSTEPKSRLLVACRLSEKAWHSGFRTFILTENPGQRQILDDLLWTFRPGSFLTHAIDRDDNPKYEAVTLGDGPIPASAFNLVINLKSAPVDPPASIERIIEIIDQDEPTRAAGRQRYRHYQKMGKTVRNHRISI